MQFEFKPIGLIHSCFKEKFGIPRQSGLVTAARAMLEILPPFDQNEAFKGLEDFSHVWVIFVFHGIPSGKWHPTVRPPRMGGNRRTGVFATRSGFRPNSIGMSAVRLTKICRMEGKLNLYLSGVDLLDQTPVLDIKPYLPYADMIPGASGGFASNAPYPSLTVAFTDQSRQTCIEREKTYPGLADLITQVLQADPRPAYMSSVSKRTEFGMRLYDLNIRWSVRQQTIVVRKIEAAPTDSNETEENQDAIKK
jgi:tRNA-Thr(GGU) m(6)t(6)A37 methyltransferase TsaA